MASQRPADSQQKSKPKTTHVTSPEPRTPSVDNRATPLLLEPKTIMTLQRTIGNQAVSQLVMGKKSTSSLIQRGVGSSKGKKSEETEKETKTETKKSAPKVIDPSTLEKTANLIGRTPDSGYVVTKKPIGTVEGFSGFYFFTSEGVHIGNIDVIDAVEYPEKDTVQYTFIQNRTNGKVKGAADLVAWYLTKYSSLKYFLVKSVGNSDLALHLQTKLGMSNSTGDDYEGERSVVHEAAVKRLTDWKLP